ncbi:MAG: GAF domain-containing protein, partial [Candidatus Rokuibacteriota bacterium]
VREVAALRASAGAGALAPPAGVEEPWEGVALARVLKEFTRAFAAGFDLPRVLDMFLDAIGELVRSTRAALLLPSPDGRDFRVVAHRGLAPKIVESVRLPAGAGLAHWLVTQGRPARVHDLTDPDVVRELKLLQSVLAVPLLAHGEIVAILVVGQPVFGSTYGRRETETLFDLATHLATAIRDIALHHQIEREKQFSERILEHMSSGVITIGRDQRVGLMNRRAEEILGLPASSVLTEDLRVLPSPLGDMLYDTLRGGRAVSRVELQLALRGLWLEVSTYPVHGADDQAPLGAVLVFEDLTAQKELAAQKRQADQTQLLTRVVARIADEIKNPLVSINTFIELIGERYDDPDFRKHFSSVVRRDVRRVVEVLEKLAALVTEGELNFTTVDVHTVVDDVVTAIELADDGPAKPLQLDVARDDAPLLVKTDAVQLRRALSYLVWYLTHNSPPDQARVTLSVARHAERDGGESVRVLIGSRTASVPPDKLHRVFDPVLMVQESLIDVGPAVSQRLIEAAGGKLSVRQARNELAFLVSLPPATS